MNGDKGNLVISLDFELLWGLFDKVDWRSNQAYFIHTRNSIPKILKLFEEYQISCTWATVGMLFNHNWDEWNSNIPSDIPQYEEEKFSAYSFGILAQTRENEELLFAPEIVNQIHETPGQEIGTHTYSHYYCKEKGQGISAFKADLQKAKEMAEKSKIEMTSLVFPRNQFNEEYIKICREEGIKTVRSNPVNWYWRNTQNDALLKRVFRTADAYVGLNDKSYLLSHPEERGVLVQKASRFLRPPSSNSYIDELRLKRIVSEMTYASRERETYHLWWHPHNFGSRPEKSLNELRQLLDHFKKCRERYGFESLSMKQLLERGNV